MLHFSSSEQSKWRATFKSKQDELAIAKRQLDAIIPMYQDSNAMIINPHAADYEKNLFEKVIWRGRYLLGLMEYKLRFEAVVACLADRAPDEKMKRKDIKYERSITQEHTNVDTTTSTYAHCKANIAIFKRNDQLFYVVFSSNHAGDMALDDSLVAIKARLAGLAHDINLLRLKRDRLNKRQNQMGGAKKVDKDSVYHDRNAVVIELIKAYQNYQRVHRQLSVLLAAANELIPREKIARCHQELVRQRQFAPQVKSIDAANELVISGPSVKVSHEKKTQLQRVSIAIDEMYYQAGQELALLQPKRETLAEALLAIEVKLLFLTCQAQKLTIFYEKMRSNGEVEVDIEHVNSEFVSHTRQMKELAAKLSLNYRDVKLLVEDYKDEFYQTAKRERGGTLRGTLRRGVSGRGTFKLTDDEKEYFTQEYILYLREHTKFEHEVARVQHDLVYAELQSSEVNFGECTQRLRDRLMKFKETYYDLKTNFLVQGCISDFYMTHAVLFIEIYRDTYWLEFLHYKAEQFQKECMEEFGYASKTYSVDVIAHTRETLGLAEDCQDAEVVDELKKTGYWMFCVDKAKQWAKAHTDIALNELGQYLRDQCKLSTRAIDNEKIEAVDHDAVVTKVEELSPRSKSYVPTPILLAMNIAETGRDGKDEKKDSKRPTLPLRPTRQPPRHQPSLHGRSNGVMSRKKNNAHRPLPSPPVDKDDKWLTKRKPAQKEGAATTFFGEPPVSDDSGTGMGQQPASKPFS